MSLFEYKPVTASLRSKRSVKTLEIQNYNKPYKKLTIFNLKAKGRNNKGKITIRRRGGGHKKRYRLILFKKLPECSVCKVIRFEYDPNRSSHIALIQSIYNKKNYILKPDNLKIGDTIYFSKKIFLNQIGSSFPLSIIPLGETIHNIELSPGKGGQLARSAGSYAKIMAKIRNFVAIELPSKEVRLINENCVATLGKVSNTEYALKSKGKAGASRWLGIRPSVRGSAMNPVDHPHGGGEGKSPIGRPSPLTPWGKKTLGVKTRNKKKLSSKFIISKKHK